ncbi:hypothetical protein YC2023_033528 [Brassica napus]
MVSTRYPFLRQKSIYKGLHAVAHVAGLGISNLLTTTYRLVVKVECNEIVDLIIEREKKTIARRRKYPKSKIATATQAAGGNSPPPAALSSSQMTPI